MARPKKEYPPEKLAALRADWVGSTLSPNALEQKHGIPRSTIRDLMDGIEREGGEKKRALLRAQAAGIKEGMDPEAIDQVVRTEAREDGRVMGIAASNSLGVMDQVAAALARIQAPAKDDEDAAQTLERIHLRSPKSLLQLSQANAHALEAWRRARELDAPGDDDKPRRVVRVTVVDPE